MGRKNIQDRNRRVRGNRINYRETSLLIARICKGVQFKVGSKGHMPFRIVENIQREIPDADLKYKVKMARHILNNIYGFRIKEVEVKDNLEVICTIPIYKNNKK